MSKPDDAHLALIGQVALNNTDEVVAAVVALVKENERLRAALEPFDDALGEDEPELPDETRVTLKYGPVSNFTLTLGDLRRARAAR